jgi:hypothetical protein
LQNGDKWVATATNLFKLESGEPINGFQTFQLDPSLPATSWASEMCLSMFVQNQVYTKFMAIYSA